MVKKIISLANQMWEQFEQAKRGEGDNAPTFWRLKEWHPEWMQTVCRKAHSNGEMSPNDIRYEFITDALVKITEQSEDASETDLDEAGYEFECDIYNKDLLNWIGSSLDRSWYVDQVLQDGQCKEFFTLLQAAQVSEKEEVYRQVLDALREEAENIDDDEDSEEEETS